MYTEIDTDYSAHMKLLVLVKLLCLMEGLFPHPATPNNRFNLTMAMYATGPDNALKVKAETVIPASIALTRPLQVKQMLYGHYTTCKRRRICMM